MDTLIRPLALLPTVDWLALLFFFGAWVGYATFAKRLAAVRPSILVSTNQWRRRWMLQATYRDHLEPAAVQL